MALFPKLKHYKLIPDVLLEIVEPKELKDAVKLLNVYLHTVSARGNASARKAAKLHGLKRKELTKAIEILQNHGIVDYKKKSETVKLYVPAELEMEMEELEKVIEQHKYAFKDTKLPKHVPYLETQYGEELKNAVVRYAELVRSLEMPNSMKYTAVEFFRLDRFAPFKAFVKEGNVAERIRERLEKKKHKPRFRLLAPLLCPEGKMKEEPGRPEPPDPITDTTVSTSVPPEAHTNTDTNTDTNTHTNTEKLTPVGMHTNSLEHTNTCEEKGVLAENPATGRTGGLSEMAVNRTRMRSEGPLGKSRYKETSKREMRQKRPNA